MSDKANIEKLYNKYLTKMNSLIVTDEIAHYLKGISKGTNKYMRVDRVESSAFDDSWIDQIENVIMDLGDIVANPRQNTKTVSDITPIELAKKINNESVIHLASHTQFIKEVTEGGDVIPSKILNISHDDDIHTYENRFIATFIRKLLLFVEKRYEYVAKFAPLKDEEVLFVKNQSVIDGSEVEIETKIKVKTPKEDVQGVKASSYLKRIESIREYVLYFYSSSFMKQFKNERDVRNPILQTNIIRKNLKYHHCYEVYRFIEKYDSLGINYKVNETFSEFSQNEMKELNYLTLANFLALKGKHMSSKHITNSKSYKPKILKSIDDESFIYGPLTNKPISFIRVDEDFDNFLQTRVDNSLPPYMSKRQKDYYENELSLKKSVKTQLEETEKLKKRKAKESDKFDKLFNEYVKERYKEEERIKVLINDAVKELKDYYYNILRDQLIKQAKIDINELNLSLEQEKPKKKRKNEKDKN